MKKEGKIGRLAKAMLVALLVAAVAGCDNMTGGEGEKEGERKVFVKQMRSFKGKLEVGVSDGGAVAVTFSRADGKVFKGEGVVAAKKVSVDAKGEEASEVYHFSGVYEGSGFKETLFGKKGQERAFDFNKEEKEHLAYHGTVQTIRNGSKRLDYDIIVTVKSESAVTILFQRKVETTESYTKPGATPSTSDFQQQGGLSERVRYAVEGTRQGDEVAATVSLEGETFDFRALLSEDGSLRETKLLGERGYVGDKGAVETVVWEAAVAGGKGEDAYKGRLRVALSISQYKWLQARRAKAVHEARVKSKELATAAAIANSAKEYQKMEIGRLWVRYYDETDARDVVVHERDKKVRLGMYEGTYFAGSTEDKVLGTDEWDNSANQWKISGTAGLLLHAASDKIDNVSHSSEGKKDFVLVLKGKGWYDADKKSFGSGVLFGRRDMVEYTKKTVSGADEYTVNYAASKELLDVAGKLKLVK